MKNLFLKAGLLCVSSMFIVGCDSDNDKEPTFFPTTASLTTGSHGGSLATEDKGVILVRAYKDDNGNSLQLYYPDDSDVAAYAVIETDSAGKFRFSNTDETEEYNGDLLLSSQSFQGSLADLAGLSLSAIIGGGVSTFTLDGNGNISSQSGACQLSGSFVETSVAGIGTAELTLAGCGDIDGNPKGFIVRNNEDVPAVVRIVATENGTVYDLLGYQN